jgi:hypothetical protein
VVEEVIPTREDPKLSFTISRALQQCSNQKDFYAALHVMHLCHHSSIELNVEIGTLFVKTGCKLGLGKEVLENLEQHNWIVVYLNGVHFLFVHFSINKDLRSMGKLVNLCKKRSILLKSESWHIVVRALVEDNRTDDALLVLGNIITEQRLIPERATFTVVMNALKYQHKNQEIIDLNQKMQELKINPSSTSTLLTARAHFQTGDVDAGVISLSNFLG